MANKFRTLLFWAVSITAGFIVGLVFWQNRVHESEAKLAQLIAVSKVLFSEHMHMRLWITEKGGVYIVKDSENPTSPFLEQLLGRSPDVETKDGRVLTLRNPALIFRELSEKKRKQGDVDFRLVSLNPVNPVNLPHNAFEREGLAALARDSKAELFELGEENGREVFRYLAPFVTEKGCLKCHESAGYKVGDVRGAISVFMPTGAFAENSHGLPRWRQSESILVVLVVVALLSALYVFFVMMQRNLAKARDEALRATGAKSLFVSNLSHDLRTPLGGILGLLDVLKFENGLSERQKEHLQHIENSAEFMTRILGDSLDMARIESGKLEIIAAPFSMQNLLAHVVAAFPEGVRSPQVSLVTSVDSRCPSKVVGDETRIQQILMNLVSNAVKYTTVGQIQVSVHVEDRDTAELLLRCVVEDSGAGISKENLSKVFVPFVRLNSKKHNHSPGTGLGLPIARQLARLMGGDVTVTSELGRGSRFVATLRVRKV